jgi:hypothetical protein
MPISAEISSESFLNSDMTPIDVHFDIFLSEVRPQRHPADPTLLLGFIAITDHPSAGEALPGSSS